MNMIATIVLGMLFAPLSSFIPKPLSYQTPLPSLIPSHSFSLGAHLHDLEALVKAAVLDSLCLSPLLSSIPGICRAALPLHGHGCIGMLDMVMEQRVLDDVFGRHSLDLWVHQDGLTRFANATTTPIPFDIVAPNIHVHLLLVDEHTRRVSQSVSDLGLHMWMAFRRWESTFTGRRKSSCLRHVHRSSVDVREMMLFGLQ